MDYSLLLAVHNITEEMKSTQKLSLLPPLVIPSSPPSSTDIPTNTHEELRTTLSTDSGITMSTVPNLPTYIQYIRVIEFIRTQQEPSLRTLSVSNAGHSLTDHIETASITTVKPDASPTLNLKVNQINDNQSVIYRNNKSPVNRNDTSSSSFHVTNALIGGDLWYNRQNLSRLTMYVICFFYSNRSIPMNKW
jgi:hypothetical protein